MNKISHFLSVFPFMLCAADVDNNKAPFKIFALGESEIRIEEIF